MDKIKQLPIIGVEWILNITRYENLNEMPFLPLRLGKLTKLNNRLLARV